MPILFTNIRTLPSTDVSSGGMPFAHQPPHPGFALVGLVISAGHWIDRVAPIYAEMMEDGTMGPQMQGPSFGGDGGTMHELRVAPGHLVTGIQTRSGNFVDAIRLLEAKWDGSAIDSSSAKWTAWVGSPHCGGVERTERLVEPQGGAVAIGIAGRAGHYLDNLTLIGAEIVRVSGSAVARATNRSSRTTVAAG